MMVQTKNQSNVTLQVVHTATPVSSQQTSNYSKIAETYKDNIYYTPQGAGIAGLGVNIDRQSYKYTSKTTDEEKTSTKKALLNKDFRQAIASVLIEQLILLKSMEKVEQQNFFVTCSYHQHLFKQMGKTLAIWSKKN